MTLEQEVTNSELSQKLKELGYPQEGLFYWEWTYDNYNGYDRDDHIIVYGEPNVKAKNEFCVAPTVAELGEWLPRTLKDANGRIYGLRIGGELGPVKYFIGYFDVAGDSWDFEDENFNTNELFFDGFNSILEAETKMLIWLVENKYISFPK